MGLPVIFRRGSPFAFPFGRNPGFDPSHLASVPAASAQGVISVACLGSKTPVCLGLSQGGTALTQNSGNSLQLNGIIGPCLNKTAGNAGFALTTLATPPTATSVTIAWIGICPVNSSNAVTLLTYGQNALHITSSIVNLVGGSTASGSVTLTPGQPYFIAASAPKGGTNQVKFVIVNLATGQIQTDSSASNYVFSAPSNANLQVGAPQSTTNPLVSACAMISAAGLGFAQLMQWGMAPWDFWYPPTLEKLMFAGLAAGSIAPPTLAMPRRVFLRR